MISASDGYALCEHVEDRIYRVVRKGSKRKMVSARRAANRDCPNQSFCIFLVVSKEIGDLVS